MKIKKFEVSRYFFGAELYNFFYYFFFLLNALTQNIFTYTSLKLDLKSSSIDDRVAAFYQERPTRKQ